MDTTLTDPLVGRVLDGRYRVEARIARGGMASVYVAMDTRLDRTVAVKVMHPALADDEEFVARFIREARAAARLSHPNVVAVYDQGADSDAVFLVMENVPGHTLRDLLRQQARLTPGQALAVMEPVLAALAAAHDAGLVHRDVKPENVLLAQDGRVKVADFGLARAIAGSNLTSTAGLLIGTVAYLAPEQVHHGVADARSDVYAAGVMLYELLTGRPPFTGETPIAVAYRHVNEDVPPPSAQAPGISPAVDALVGRATSREPSRRPVDAGAFLVALTSLRDASGYRDGVPRVSRESAGQAHTDVFRTGGTRVISVVDSDTPPAVGAGALAATGPVEGAGGDDGYEQPPRRWLRRWPAATLLVVLLAAAAGVAGWWFGTTRYVSAPGLLDMTYAQAQARTHHLGLHVRQGPPVYSDTVLAGEVATQNPAPGRNVRSGGTLTVDMSLGVLKRPVPNLSGDTVARATALLARSTFVVSGKRSIYSTAIHQGLVVTTDPPPGTVLRHGSPVTLVLSAGPRPLPLPNLVGEQLGKAESTLRSDGLLYSLAPAVYDANVPKGHVSAESPQGGTTVLTGSTIVLTPSLGPHLYRVPSVTYDPVGQAVAILQRAGFVPQIDQLPGGPGIVLRQSPGGGSEEPHGTTITLYVF